MILDEESFARLLRARDLIHARYAGPLRIDDLDRPYGIETVLCDDSGNWFSLVQRPG